MKCGFLLKYELFFSLFNDLHNTTTTFFDYLCNENLDNIFCAKEEDEEELIIFWNGCDDDSHGAYELFT